MVFQFKKSLIILCTIRIVSDICYLNIRIRTDLYHISKYVWLVIKKWFIKPLILSNNMRETFFAIYSNEITSMKITSKRIFKSKGVNVLNPLCHQYLRLEYWNSLVIMYENMWKHLQLFSSKRSSRQNGLGIDWCPHVMI